MYITTETIITFDPVKEQDAILRFTSDNDMSKWMEHPSTVGLTFRHKETYKVDWKDET